MPKRHRSDRMERYRRKLQKLEEEDQRKRKRIIYSSSDSEEKSDNEEASPEENLVDPVPTEEGPELDAEILSALGEATEEAPKYGPKVHESLPRIFTPILLKGLTKETKEKLVKEHQIPENLAFLKAPIMNPEIAAAISEPARTRDKRVESIQQQLGAGIAALTKGLECLLDNEKRLEAIKVISDSCRLLCDLHFTEGEARKKFITPGLDKSFSNLMQDMPRDDMLFGSKLPDKIKASKLIEKQGLQIKRPLPIQKPAAPSAQPSTSTNRPRPSGNWLGPPRFSSRGGRGAPKRGGAASRGRPPTASASSKPTYQHKQRAPNQQ